MTTEKGAENTENTSCTAESGIAADPGVWRRRAARVILLDHDDHVLLVHAFDPARPEERYWYSLGGGIDEGETSREAALRELHEEVGLVLVPDRLVGPLGSDRVVFEFDGITIDQEQEFFGARVDRFEPEAVAWEETEVRSTVAIEWMPLHGIPTMDETVYPPQLLDIVERLRDLE